MAQQHEHGGDVEAFAARYGRPPLDFSVNTNPLGMPPGAEAAAAAALREAAAYPDPHCRALRGALAAHEGVPAGHILCGNGAADLIYRLVQAVRPRRALLTAPAFAEYERALETVGCAVDIHPLAAENDFVVQPAILGQITPDIDILFLCEPANPTGQTTPRPLLEEVAARCAQTGTLLVMDECFNGFLDDPATHTLLAAMKNLFILRAFTKFYAMAGLRLGYGICADEELLERMARAGQPWPVSGIAQAAGVAALEDEDYPHKTRALVRKERDWLAAELGCLGCRVYGSRANFVFFQSPRADLWQQLAQRGILIRDCANYRGLAPGYYRAGLRLREDNEKLVDAVRECLRGAEGAVV